MEKYGECKLKEVGLKKWLENYLYHYRYLTIGVVIGVVLVIFFIKDIAFQEKVDTTILMATKYSVTQEQLDEIAALFNQYGTDFDGDGKVNIKVNYIMYPDVNQSENVDPQIMMGAQVKMIGEIQLCESNIIILDENVFSIYGSEELLENLSGFNLSVPLHESQTMVQLSETPLGELPGMEKAGQELYIGLRNSNTQMIREKEDIAEKYDYQREVLLNFLNNQVVNPPSSEVESSTGE